MSVDTPTHTHCPYCSLQCGMLLTRGGVQPQHDFPTNRGGLCSKGWTATTLLDHPQRLLTPLVRSVPGDRTSEFRAASWDEALSLVVSKIVELQARTAQMRSDVSAAVA